MQILRQHKNVYKLYAWARTQECLDAYRIKYEDRVRHWNALRAEGVSLTKCAEFVGISRATYYRHKRILKDLAQAILPPSKALKHRNKTQWGEAEKQLVLEVRRDNETFGKEKIGVVLRRDKNQTISDSTVGRILSFLRQKGLITRSRSAPQKRTRNFSKGHAKGWKYKDYTDIEVGERVQIDHMTATKNGVTCKHFQAWERRSKHIHAQVYSNATARSAKRFLLELVEIAPYKIISIQVDGGSEFMADFETACEQMKIPLIVLPPARPKYNGGVERGNRTFREEFYACRDLIADSIGAMRFDLRKAVEKYNTFRPHHALKGKTPMEYLRITQAEAA
jgi:putative transposase|tara:strand:- start:9 stop:1019 length:1011 start_codon:yes stop_codon:yes gene_type:complete